MSRLEGYLHKISELKEIDDLRFEEGMIILMDELNTSMAMIADHLDQIEKDQRQIQRELGKRK
jgi:hypothetical protein